MRHRFTYWARHGVPGPNFIEIGQTFMTPYDYTEWAIKKWGRVYGSYDFVGKLITVNEPDLIRDIMVKDFDVFPDHKHQNIGSSKLSLSLTFLPGDDQWKRIRSILSPAFTSGKLKAMMAHISDISDKFVNNLYELETIGIYRVSCNLSYQ